MITDLDIKMYYKRLLFVFYFLLITSELTYSAVDFYERLGVTKGASLKEIRKAFKKIALTKHPDKNMDDPKAHEAFLEINRAYEVLKDEELRKKYDMYGEEGLKEDHHGGHYESWNFYQNEFGLYDDDEEIITLSRGDFAQSVEGYDGVWFINYYSPHCSHCHDLAPTWRELGRDMEGVIRIGAVNCGDEWELCRSQGVHSYPSLIIYPSTTRFRGSRDLESLVRFSMQYISSNLHTLTADNLKEKLTRASHLPWLITYCSNDGDCLSKRTCTKLSAILKGLVNVGYTDCRKNSALCDQLDAHHDSYYYADKSLNKETAIHFTSLHMKDVAFQVFSQLPDFTTMDAKSFAEMEEWMKSGDGKAWLVHFVNGDTSDLELKKLPAMLDNINIGRVDCRKLSQVCRDLDIFKYPSFMVFKPSKGRELYYGRLTAHDVAAFAKDSLANQLETLGPAHFPRITTSKDPWVIDFFAPWCPPCMHFLPEFRKASRISDMGVKFGTLDCSIHSSICRQYNVHSYPTTIFYNMSIPHHFHGEHDVQDVLDFLQDILKPSVISLDPATFNTRVFERPTSQMWVVDFFLMTCQPCRQLAPEWRRLAKRFTEGQDIYIADIDCGKHRAFCQEQGVRSYPTIRLYAPGKGRQFERFTGWHRDADSLEAWVADNMPSKVTTLDYESFMSEVIDNNRMWIVDFYTMWCGHCQVFKPVFEQVAEALEGRVEAGKVDCDDESWLCDNANVMSYPTVIFYPPTYNKGFHSGIVISAHTHNAIIRRVEQLIKQYEKPKKPRDEF